MNLNAPKWKEFLLTKICDVDYGNKFDNDKMTYYNPSVNFVSRTGDNNGVKDVVDRIDGVKPYKAGCISVALGGSIGACYLQTSPFYTGQNVAVLTFDDSISENTKLFFTQVFMFEVQKKFVAFGRELNKHIKTDFSVFLPIQYNSAGSPLLDNTYKYSEQGYIPDWQFMEDYIKSLNYKPLTTKRVNEKKMELNVSQWEEFVMDKVFEISSGKGITKEELEENEGDFEAVQSGEENNGVIGKIDLEYCKSMNYVFTNKPCLTIARTGTAGFTSFHKNGCAVGDSAKILLVKNTSPTINQYLFLRTIFEADRFKYTYGRKVKTDKLRESIIKLPIQRNADGSPVIDKEKKYHNKGYIPDWQFMEDYINSLPYSDRILNV